VCGCGVCGVIDESKLMMIIFTMINNRNTDNNLAKRNSTE
jgi:hypothetical protein